MAPIFALILLLLSLAFFLLYRPAKYRGLPLPPGSMGWPYIGETLRLYSENPNKFFSSRQKKYGDVFKTHILGYPSVMLASPEAAKFVLVTHAHLFKTTFPSSKECMIGPHALFFHEGEYHKRIRQLVQSSFKPEALKHKICEVESAALRALESWNNRTINTLQEMKKYAFDVGVLQIFGRQEGMLNRDELKAAYHTLERGYNCFPIDIVGTPYNAAMKARKHLNSLVSRIITERRSRGEASKDLLWALMESADERKGKLTDEQIADNIIGVIFAAQDTTASALTWLVKYLGDNPSWLEAVTHEQELIAQHNLATGSRITWSDVKSMPVTYKVLQETLRLSSILSFTFREVVADVEYNGHVIPKGWKVMPLFRNIHHNGDLFANPLEFNPSRFETQPKPSTFLPFGNGTHSCPGNELAKLEILVLIHHLTTKYKWTFACPSEEIEYMPFLVPKQGLPITISHK